MSKQLRTIACTLVVALCVAGCVDPAAVDAAKAAAERSIEADNQAHQEKIAKLRVTNPELFEEPDPSKRPSLQRPVQRETQFCDTAGGGTLTGLGLTVCGGAQAGPEPSPPASP